MNVEERRRAEQAKYEQKQKQFIYRMGWDRKVHAVYDLCDIHDLDHLPPTSYLDVGCGKGEMLDAALGIGFVRVKGVECVPSLCYGDIVVQGQAHDLPFPSSDFDVVSMFDVIEHLPPGDDELACRELERVSDKFVLLTANNRPCRKREDKRLDLHINRRPYEEWDRLFREWFTGDVTWLRPNDPENVSETWMVEL